MKRILLIGSMACLALVPGVEPHARQAEVRATIGAPDTLEFPPLDSFPPRLRIRVRLLQALRERLGGVPPEMRAGRIAFRCFTSKRHYLPGERLEYRAMLDARVYPDRESSKILEVELRGAGGVAAVGMQQFGLGGDSGVKELFGVLESTQPLKPGAYRLVCGCTDQRTGLVLRTWHDLAVSGPGDPLLLDMPFKYVKDFTVIRGPDARWHLFAITGDWIGDHSWKEDGQERTFGHASSDDLRRWTVHRPVVSISDRRYPDGRGRFADRNVWAPHVLEHSGTYYMFYAAVNRDLSQSIALAMSSDLFRWVEYAGNPVLTLEGVDWARWRRNAPSDCRDPMVLADRGRFYLYFTATARGRDRGDEGVVAVAASQDLLHWGTPRIALRGPVGMESPQVWREGDRLLMTISTHGAGVFASPDPMSGWRPVEFARPDIAVLDRRVRTSASYAEEVLPLASDSLLVASLTMRPYGNTIYFTQRRADAPRNEVFVPSR